MSTTTQAGEVDAIETGEAEVTQTAAAASELFQGICQGLADGRGVHLETAITAGAYLAGATLLERAGVDLTRLPAGAAVIVDEVNETGPLLLETLFDLCDRSGVDPEAPMPSEVPQSNRSHRNYDELMAAFTPLFDQIVDRHNIDVDRRPFVAVRAVAQFIVAGREQLDPALAKTIATHAIIRAAKTVPPPHGKH
jgi:hypothetical protein